MKNKFIVTGAAWFVTIGMGCASHAVYQSYEVIERLDKINLGAQQNEIKNKFGTPSQITENYGPLKLRLLEYFNRNSKPDLQFAVDSQSGILVEKAIWVYPSSDLYSRNQFNAHFSSIARMTYSPCHTRSDKDAVEADESLGFYSAIENDHPVYISWSTPEIVKLRINQLYEKCPDRQPKRK